MKKSICVLLILTGFSAFAFGPGQCGKSSAPASKVIKQKAAKKAMTPLSDLMASPF